MTSGLLHSIARGCFGFKQSVYMAVFVYLDASGDPTDPNIKVISVGGYIAHESVWAGIETEWPSLLARFEVSELHMRKLAHFKGEYSKWADTPSRRDEFMRAITDVLARDDKTPIGATLPLSVYRAFNRRYCLEEAAGTAYTVALMNALALVTEWKEKNKISEPVLVFLEKGDNEQPEWDRFSKRRLIWEPDFLVQPIPVKKKIVEADGTVRYVWPFQASDFIAYEQAKAITDLIVKGKRELRQSMRRVAEKDPFKSLWKTLWPRFFASYVKNAGIPKRFNHFLDESSVRQPPLDPLCYVNGSPVKCYLGPDGFLEESLGRRNGWKNA